MAKTFAVPSGGAASAGTFHNGTGTYDIAKAAGTYDLYGFIGTVNVTAASGLYDFTQAPYSGPAVDTNVAAVSGGYNIFLRNASRAGWDITGAVTGSGAKWRFTVTSDVDVASSEISARWAGNSALTSFYNPDSAPFSLVAGVPKTIEVGVGTAPDGDSRYLGIYYTGGDPINLQVRSLELVR